MAIDSLGGYKSISNATAVRNEQKAVDVEKVAVEVNATSKVTQSGKHTESALKSQETTENTTKETSENHLKSVLSVANQKIRMTNTRCEFEYHDKTKRVSIKVIDKTTDEVVREIPPEEALEMVEKIWELAGLIVDERR